jgi:ActD protein
MNGMGGRVLVSIFEDEDRLIKATNAAREAGLDIVDVFAPYAVHGIDRAMGLPPSRLPWVTFWLGLFGAVTMTVFQFWVSAVSWPINIGGKPWNSLPAFVPAIFEVTVLCAGVGTVLFFIWWAGLRPGLQSPLSDLRVTNDRFALVVSQSKAGFNRKTAEALLSRFQPVSIQERDLTTRVTGKVA